MTNDKTIPSPEMTEISVEQPRGVLLVGSVPLTSAEEVFRTTSAILSERLRRIPDGETGVRTNWIGWQIAFLASNSHLEVVPPDPNAYAPLPHFKLRAPVASGDIVFDQLGYADAAKASYALFSQLKQESNERSTGFTCQCRATVAMMPTLLHSRACSSILRRNCIWDWSTLRMEWRERGNVLPLPKGQL